MKLVWKRLFNLLKTVERTMSIWQEMRRSHFRNKSLENCAIAAIRHRCVAAVGRLKHRNASWSVKNCAFNRFPDGDRQTIIIKLLTMRQYDQNSTTYKWLLLYVWQRTQIAYALAYNCNSIVNKSAPWRILVFRKRMKCLRLALYSFCDGYSCYYSILFAATKNRFLLLHIMYYYNL